ncbi:MAG: hypothetical protein IKC79_03385, partial [Clostridia bacterium]|nr:hypothetical protein [Clostridia bacterium]
MEHNNSFNYKVYKESWAETKYVQKVTDMLKEYRHYILTSGDQGVLGNRDFYVYSNLKNTGHLIIPSDAMVDIQGTEQPIGQIVRMCLDGRWSNGGFKYILPAFIHRWAKLEKLSAGLDANDLATIVLLDSIDDFLSNLCRIVEDGDGTKIQNELYNRLKTGLPMPTAMSMEIPMRVGGTIKRCNLGVKIRAAFASNERARINYNKEVLNDFLRSKNIVYYENEKEELKRQDLLAAIQTYKDDIITGQAKGTLKTKEYPTYDKIVATQQFDLPIRLKVNIGTPEYPVQVEVFNIVENIQ